MLKSVGWVSGVIGAGIFLNYHFSRPVVNSELLKEKELGKKIGPLPFPEDMVQRWPIHLINSIGDTYQRVTGRHLFLDHFEKELNQLKDLLSEQDLKQLQSGTVTPPPPYWVWWMRMEGVCALRGKRRSG